MVFFLANFLFVSTVGDTAQIIVTVLICMLAVTFIAIVVIAFLMMSKEERNSRRCATLSAKHTHRANKEVLLSVPGASR